MKNDCSRRTKGDRNGEDFLNRCKKIPALGLLLAVASGVTFSLALTWVKLSRVFPLMVLFERSALQFFFFLSAVVFSNRRNFGIETRRMLLLSVLSATFGGLFPILCHSAMFFIPVADIVAIFFASPAFITLYDCAATRKNPGIYKMVVLGLALTGVVFVTKPTFIFGTDPDTADISWLEGCVLAIGSSVSYAAFCISCSHCKQVPVESMNVIISGFTLLFNVPVLTGLDKFRLPDCGYQSGYALASAIAGVLAVLLLILATKLEKAGPVAIGNSVELPSVILFQIVLTGEMPTWNSYLGSALIVTSVLISGWLRWQQDKREEFARAVKEARGAPQTKPLVRKTSVDLSLLEESAV